MHDTTRRTDERQSAGRTHPTARPTTHVWPSYRVTRHDGHTSLRHPRACGDHSATRPIPPSRVGPPPRTRGGRCGVRLPQRGSNREVEPLTSDWPLELRPSSTHCLHKRTRRSQGSDPRCQSVAEGPRAASNARPAISEAPQQLPPSRAAGPVDWNGPGSQTRASDSTRADRASAVAGTKYRTGVRIRLGGGYDHAWQGCSAEVVAP